MSGEAAPPLGTICDVCGLCLVLDEYGRDAWEPLTNIQVMRLAIRQLKKPVDAGTTTTEGP